MKLSYEYNSFVVGIVVTDEETDRSLNLQFDNNNPYSYAGSWYLRWGCTGDDTYKHFTEQELQEVTEYLDEFKELHDLCDLVTAIQNHYDAREYLLEIHDTTGEITVEDIWEAWSLI